jgi:hypothetical protein
MRLMMRCLLFFLLLSSQVAAQVAVQGVVKDAKDNSPLSFCSVAVKGTGKGTLTNEEGVFSISAEPGRDTLAFYYLGYKKLSVPVSVLQQNGEVLLSEELNALEEVTVKYDEERLYKILLACKAQLLDRKPVKSKAYYQLETRINNDPVEMLECYYNARVKGASIEQLLYKNGRVGLSKYDNRYFASMNTSRAIQYLDLTKESPYLPDIPLQMNLEKMMADYKLSQLPSEESVYHIAFTPKKHNRAQFKGDIWIDRESSSILKIKMSCDSAAIHPFVADGLDKLGYVSMYVTHTYQQEDGPGPLQHIDFSYQFDYIDQYKGPDKKTVSKPAKRAKTKGVVYFYDFKKPFIAPYYKYDVKDEDYQKIAMFPYNSFFWDNAEGLMHTEEQQRSLDFLAKHGQLMNFKGRNGPNKFGYEDFVELNSALWSDTTRIFFTRKNKDVDDNKPYQIKAQIYMDINPVGDSVHHFSVSVFDIKNTYFSSELGDRINCVVNMYFDLYEIERLKMEDKLEQRAYSVEEIEALYKKTVDKTERMAREYLEEVNLGMNEEAMRKWNAYVYEQLGIDNIKAFKYNW